MRRARLNRKYLVFAIIFSLAGVILFCVGCSNEEISERVNFRREWRIDYNKFEVGETIILGFAVQINGTLADFLPEEEPSYFNLIAYLWCPDGGYVVYNVTFRNTADYYPVSDKKLFYVSSAEILVEETESLEFPFDDIIDVHGRIMLGVVKESGNYTVQVDPRTGWWLENAPALYLYYSKVIYPYRWLYIPAIFCIAFAVFSAVYYVRMRRSRGIRRKIFKRH